MEIRNLCFNKEFFFGLGMRRKVCNVGGKAEVGAEVAQGEPGTEASYEVNLISFLMSLIWFREKRPWWRTWPAVSCTGQGEEGLGPWTRYQNCGEGAAGGRLPGKGER